MFIINQTMLDRIFRNEETFKHILNLGNYLFCPDNYFNWALPDKPFWVVSITSIKPFRYAHLIRPSKIDL